MALLVEIPIPVAELYLLRFCVTETKHHVPIAPRRYRPLIEFAQITWTPRSRGQDALVLDQDPIEVLTTEHFNLIQAHAEGFGHLFVWFPPRTQPSGNETRLLLRAGVPLKFVVQKIGVYKRDLSKYNG